jgi:hypothetical protein
MNRSILAASVLAAGAMLAITSVAAPPVPAPPASAAPPKAPGEGPGGSAVSTLAGLKEKELKWGLTHQEVTDVYNLPGGLLDREYAPQLGRLQPGVEMTQLESDRDNRKVNFQRSYTPFQEVATGYDLTPIHSEYTYKNEEALQKIFKDGKARFLFYIKDHLWKIYDEVPLKADGPLGSSYQEAVTKLNALLGAPGRVRRPDPSQGLERTTTDWQDARSHLRAVDRSEQHIVGVAMEDKSTLASLASLRSNKPTDFTAIDPSITAVTKGGVSDPSAAHHAGSASADAGAPKPKH